MLNELLELINPFNSSPEGSESDSVIRELSLARINEVGQLVRNTIYADQHPIAKSADHSNSVSEYPVAPAPLTLKHSDSPKAELNFNAPVGMGDANPTKEKQEFTPDADGSFVDTSVPATAASSNASAASASSPDRLAQFRQAYLEAYADMSGKRPEAFTGISLVRKD